ncbi:metallophosphoesterase [Pokkaliibacter sp. CJK22405]|uniref:metallophosphoesterase n=1 Tax=Pokkaliibacter sp. CJK22405 TaxID=3384615 RepID=UPI003984CDA4
MPQHLLHLTDLHLTLPGQLHLGVDPWQRWQQVLNTLHKHIDTRQVPHPDLVVLGGDLVHHPEGVEVYQRMAESLEPLGVDWVAVPGNHDEASWIHDALAERLPSQRCLGNWQLLLLDSTARPDGKGRGAVDESALAGLAQALAEPEKHHQLVIMHHPVLPVFNQWQDEVMAENSRSLLAHFAQGQQLRGVVCGHVHQAHHWRVGAINYWSTPAVSGQFLPHAGGFAIEHRALQGLPAARWLHLHEDGSIQTTVYRFREMHG